MEWLDGKYEGLTASDSATALDRTGVNVGMIFLDRGPSDGDGGDVAGEIATQDHTVHVVMVSCHKPDFDIAEYPIDGYVEKPVTEDDLTEIVGQYERQQGYQRALEEYFSLSSKLAAIEAHQFEEQFAANAKYDRLKTRVQKSSKSTRLSQREQRTGTSCSRPALTYRGERLLETSRDNRLPRVSGVSSRRADPSQSPPGIFE